MSENDVNSAPVVTESGVVEAAPTENVSQVETDAGVQQTEDVTQEAAAAPAGQTEEQAKDPVPYDRFKEVNDAKNDLQGQVDQLQGHLKLVGNQQPVQQAEQPQQEGLTLQVMKQMGLDPEGFVSPGDMAAVNDRVIQIVSTQQNQQMQTQQFISSHADFAQVVGHADPVTKQFVYAPPLARILGANPGLIAALQNAGAGANALAYQIAINDPTYQAELAQKAKPAAQVAGETAEQAINAANSLTSVSAVGSAGVIDKGAQIRAMSDEEFKNYTDKIKRDAGVAVM